MNFWSHFAQASRDKPILCLAPMADVTDAAFRYIIAKYSKKLHHIPKSQGAPLTHYPYVTFTEFVSADGLVRAPEEGRKKLLKDLEYSEIERPIVAQFFTSKPEYMEKAAALAVELGFDGVDINMGCPDKSVEKQGAGAVLIKNPKLAREIIAAAKQGAPHLPVSVKTRLGYNKDELEIWLPGLLTEQPAAITIHARTRKEMSKVPARWERVRRAVEIRNITPQPPLTLRRRATHRTLIFGNGDVESIEDAYKKAEETRCDGVMLGRAIFGNPWLFSNHIPSTKERLKVLAEHSKLFEEKFNELKSFAIMKKHFKSYLHGIPNSTDLKMELMEAENANRVEEIINNFLVYNNQGH